MQLYYINQPIEPLPCPVELSAEESLHIVKVLRKKVGDALFLSDGIGNLYHGVIHSVAGKQCTVMLLSCTAEYGKAKVRLHMAVAPTKNMDRFEWFIEKATEIGIQEITPLFCERSERVKLRTDRLVKIIQSAAKQSLKTYLPILNEPEKFANFIKKEHSGLKFVAYVEEAQTIQLKEVCKSGHDALILIGPEGDFSKQEIEQSKSMNFETVSLGTSRLRTETAAVVACHTFNLINS